MTKTLFENESKLTAEYLPRVKQMVRKLGPLSVGDVVMIEEADATLTGYINDGWKLSFVERLATEPDGHTILYVLTKD